MPPTSPACDEVDVEVVEDLGVLLERVGERRARLDLRLDVDEHLLEVLVRRLRRRGCRGTARCGRPASIIVANWRVKIDEVLLAGRRPPNGSLMLDVLGLLLAPWTCVMPCARSRLATSGSASASITPLRDLAGAGACLPMRTWPSVSYLAALGVGRAASSDAPPAFAIMFFSSSGSRAVLDAPPPSVIVLLDM